MTEVKTIYILERRPNTPFGGAWYPTEYHYLNRNYAMKKVANFNTEENKFSNGDPAYLYRIVEFSRIGEIEE